MPENKKFWQFCNQVENTVELLLYGDISQTSWWGDEVTPKQFAKELSDIGPLEKIIVRINSGGGDVFAAQTIGNLLEGHAAEVTAKIDGLCASAATIVACHCDKVIAANDSTYMVHPVRMAPRGYLTADEMQKLIDALNVIRENIINLYAKKTGRSTDEVTAWMEATSWWTATTAKENGFVDELTDDEEETVVENRGGTLFVNSVNTHLPFNEAPSFVQSSTAADTAAGDFVNTNGHEEVNDMANSINTVDDLRREYPELVGAIEEAAANNARSEERQRIQAIEEMALIGSEALTAEAKFTKPMSVTDFAQAMVKGAKAQGAKYMEDARNDANGSGMDGVENTAPGGKPDAFMDAIMSVGATK